MKDYWWILDEWGCMNFFDEYKAFAHARKHVDGLAEWSTNSCDRFKADNVADCWKMEDLLKWKDGIHGDEQ